MSTLQNTLTHMGNRLYWTGEPEVIPFDFVTEFTSADEQADIGLAVLVGSQRGLGAQSIPADAMANYSLRDE